MSAIWQSIEATAGVATMPDSPSAFEKQLSVPSNDVDDEEEPADTCHTMEGPRWMFQGKREKSLGPSDVKKMVQGPAQLRAIYGIDAAGNFMTNHAVEVVFAPEGAGRRSRT